MSNYAIWSFYIRENCASPYEYPLTVSMTVDQNLTHVMLYASTPPTYLHDVVLS
jgi:hypothetical protein